MIALHKKTSCTLLFFMSFNRRVLKASKYIKDWQFYLLQIGVFQLNFMNWFMALCLYSQVRNEPFDMCCIISKDGKAIKMQ